MLSYNEIRPKTIIIYNGEPCEVVESQVARKQQMKPQNQVKLKSLISGKIFAVTFQMSDKAPEANVDKKDIKFLYHKPGRLPADKQEYWFCDPNNPKDRYKLEESLLGDSKNFLKDNLIASASVWNKEGEEKIIKITLPIKMEFTVKEAPPAVKGNTVSGSNKVVVLENGTTINTPMFINTGDTIRINTETGQYVERVN